MAKKNSPRKLSLSKIYCSIFGHNYVVSKNVTDHIKEYSCSHCGQQATINSKGDLELMTPKRKEINKHLAFVHKKKLAKTNGQLRYPAA